MYCVCISGPSVRASSAAVTSDAFGGTARPLITTSATSSAGKERKASVKRFRTILIVFTDTQETTFD